MKWKRGKKVEKKVNNDEHDNDDSVSMRSKLGLENVSSIS